VRRRVSVVRGSYVVYLPKEWVVEVGVDKVREVFIVRDGRLLLVFPASESSVELVVKDRSVAEKAFLAAYIAGFDEVRVRGSVDVLERVVSLARFYGAAVVEQGAGHVVLKIVDSEVDLAALVRRMFNVFINYMLDHLAYAEKPDVRLLEAVDDEVDKLRHVVERRCTKAPSRSCTQYVLIARYIERAADHLVEYAKLSPNKSVAKELYEVASRVAEAQGDVEKVLRALAAVKSLSTRLQYSGEDLGLLHVVRVLDYLENVLEEFIDLSLLDAERVEL